MGNVYLASHESLDRKVAIKVLHEKLSSNENLRNRFKNEAQALSRMQHPNIVALYDFLEDETGLYLVMEYVEGRELDVYINTTSGPIVREEAIPLMEQILDGFQYAHDRGIVHRDIKPSNLIITNDKKIKILDFGIAKMVEGDKSLTKTGTQMGTVLYMSPEQVEGQNIDFRSDIYSLGVTLFQMVTGQCPYDNASTEFSVYKQIVNEPLPRIKTIYPGVDIFFQTLIDKSTQKQKDRRFASCEEFKEYLRKEPLKDDATILVEPEVPHPISPKVPEGITSPEKTQPPKSKKLLYLIIPSFIILIGIIIFQSQKKETSSDLNTSLNNEVSVSLTKSEEPEETIEETVSLSDINISSLNYNLMSSNNIDIYKGDEFNLTFSENNNLDSKFVFDLRCSSCSDFGKVNNTKYKGISYDNNFTVDLYLKDSDFNNEKYIDSYTFSTLNKVLNSTPEKTAKMWLENIDNQTGYSVQTKWDNSGYFNGYGSTQVTKIYYINEQYNDGDYAEVEIKYSSYDPSNNNSFELVQLIKMNYYGPTQGWKWSAKTNVVSPKQI